MSLWLQYLPHTHTHTRSKINMPLTLYVWRHKKKQNMWGMSDKIRRIYFLLLVLSFYKFCDSWYFTTVKAYIFILQSTKSIPLSVRTYLLVQLSALVCQRSFSDDFWGEIKCTRNLYIIPPCMYEKDMMPFSLTCMSRQNGKGHGLGLYRHKTL